MKCIVDNANILSIESMTERVQSMANDALTLSLKMSCNSSLSFVLVDIKCPKQSPNIAITVSFRLGKMIPN